jgi:small-conductance mechanosensitive channel
MDEMTEILNSYWDTFLILLPKIAIAVIIFIVFLIIASKLSRIVRGALSLRMDDPLIVRFLGRLAKWILVVSGLILCMFILGLGGIAGGLIAGAGVSAIIIGFAFKDIGENFLAGIILAFSRPYNIGDKVETGSTYGIVRALDLRNTHIKTFDGKDVYVPNAMVLKNPLINYTRDGFLRYEFLVGIDYDDDIQQAIDIILKAVSSVKGVLDGDKAPQVHVSELSTSTINLIVYIWTDTFDRSKDDLQIVTEVMNETKKALIVNKITMPADILELKVYNENMPIPVKLIDTRTGENLENE